MTALSRAVALLLLAGLAAIAIHERNARLHLAYEARRLVDDQGELRNEIAWLRAQIGRQENPTSLVPRARKLGMLQEGEVGTTVRAPAENLSDPTRN